jgi:DNA-binding transcriptional ArsR family regulator
MPLEHVFLAIADLNRRTILEELRRGPKTVGELASGMPVTRPAVSQHLKVLLDAGLVGVTAQGTKRIYAIDSDGFMKVNIWLDQFWSE